MKKLILTLVALMASVLIFPLFSQTEMEPVALGFPGDNFNLYAVLDVFQKSETLEEFERAINDRGNNINNLDLNNDNFIDYIGVVSHQEGNTTLIVLRDLVNDRGFQDVAVIEVTKTSRGTVFIQIIGDADLYGEDYIIEPAGAIYTTRTPNPGYVYPDGYSIGAISGNISFYINDWPIIVNLFSPSFRVYVSPWYWGHYPVYWNPWRPVYYYNYWTFHRRYYQNNLYRRTAVIRYPVYYRNYTRIRNVSPLVRDYRKSGTYDRTYEGRAFNRPIVPVTRPTNKPESKRPTAPATRPENRPEPKRPTVPVTRPTNKPESKRPTAPATRPTNKPESKRPMAPVTRPENKHESKRQTVPVTRPENKPESKRPTAPMRRPENRPEPKRQAPPTIRPENKPQTKNEARKSNPPGI
ncbi:hypothetical protein [Flavobacterium granuli]|uniref:Uncharacterized protein n=1 Tax=Flavobacterium granuli TaxID=280093 RepID=A0A1M5J317_9FLAO|nr:hypothetical protein [Flavobacterium granuli]PRZ28209.1 hypothetical protein BC624_101500 [Flavobacterium granuli]SHG34745.1 hypothetical protein SAMN05443373_101500 [Flavobacterium granuli]